MKLSFALLILAACGPKPATSTPVGGTPPGPAAGPVYAAMFAADATWSFTGTYSTQPPPDVGPSSKEPVDVTCTSKVDTVPVGKRATVKCQTTKGDPMPLGMAPEGQWISTPWGLWTIATEDTVLDRKTVLIKAVHEAHDDHITGKEGEVGEENYFAKPSKDGGWCFGWSVAAGDEAGWEMCMTHERGIVSTTAFSAGATTFELALTRK